MISLTVPSNVSAAVVARTYPMPNIMICCPIFGKAVPTGLSTETIVFDSLGDFWTLGWIKVAAALKIKARDLPDRIERHITFREHCGPVRRQKSLPLF
jgi:hypothetical protein